MALAIPKRRIGIPSGGLMSRPKLPTSITLTGAKFPAPGSLASASGVTPVSSFPNVFHKSAIPGSVATAPTLKVAPITQPAAGGGGQVAGATTVAPPPAAAPVVSPVGGGGVPSGSASAPAPSAQQSALDVAAERAVEQAEQRRASEEAAKAAEIEGLRAEFGGVKGALEQKRTAARGESELAVGGLETGLQQALRQLDVLRGRAETRKGEAITGAEALGEQQAGRVEGEKSRALRTSLSGFEDIKRGIRGSLSAIQGATDSSALPGLQGLAERDFVQDTREIGRASAEKIFDIRSAVARFVEGEMTSAREQLEDIDNTDSSIRENVRQDVATETNRLNSLLGELDVAESQGNIQEANSIREAITASRSRIDEIDAGLSDFKNTIELQKAELSDRVSSAVARANAEEARAQQEKAALQESTSGLLQLAQGLGIGGDILSALGLQTGGGTDVAPTGQQAAPGAGKGLFGTTPSPQLTPEAKARFFQ